MPGRQGENVVERIITIKVSGQLWIAVEKFARRTGSNKSAVLRTAVANHVGFTGPISPEESRAKRGIRDKRRKVEE